MADFEQLQSRALELPQAGDSWLVVVRRLRSWLQEGDQVLRAWALLCLSRSADTIVGIEILSGPPDSEMVFEHLLDFMLEPAPGSVDRPHRPAKIGFEDRQLSLALKGELDAIGIRAQSSAAPRDVDLIMADFEAALQGNREELPGLLAGEGISPSLVGEFFAAAAEFYRAEPWVKLSNVQTLAISFPPDVHSWYVTVMGQGGVEYGLVLHRTWEQVEQLFHGLNDPLEGMPMDGWHSVSFEPAYELPFADLEAIESYRWEIAGEEAYPLPAIFDQENALRPPADELKLWVMVMRAVTKFADEHLGPSKSGEYEPIVAEFEVRGVGSAREAKVCYPAGEREPGEQAYGGFRGDPAELETKLAPDRRALEGLLLDVAGGIDDPQLEQAQRIMYQAWDTPEREIRIQLAERALAKSPDCADAYVLLAEDKAHTLSEALNYYRRGVEAGEAALGERAFEEDVGYFWGLLSTRPYMRARYGLANCLWDLGKELEAESHYWDMLRLNPSDNQGVRYTLLQLLIEQGRDQEALNLLDEFEDDPSAMMVYNRALLLFRHDGPSREAAAALEQALDWNEHLPDYLLGRKRVPTEMPLRVGFGDETEAIDYAAAYLNTWRATPGALDWLAEHLTQE